MLLIFLTIITLMILGATSTDNVVIGQALENTYRNAPFVIQNFYAVMALLTCLMTTAFVNDAASRDFANKTSQLIFTKPLNKYSFLMGRFWGSTLIALIPMLGVSLGVLISQFMPWNDAERFTAISWPAHFWGIAVFAIPNVIFISAIIFAIAVWLRSTFASFIGVILLLVGYGFSQSLIGNLDNELLAQLLDPFGLATFQIETKYWTLDERNTQYLTLFSPMMLLNRLIWLGVGMFVLAVSCWRFSFAERKARRFSKETKELATSNVIAIPKVSFSYGFGAKLKQLWSQFKVDFVSTIKSPVFIVIVFAGMLDTFFSLQSVANEGFGLSALPVTYSMIDVIRAGLFVYLFVVITFYAGALVWKEREAKLDEVFDALPHPTWISYLAKLLVILTIVVVVLVGVTSMGIVNQAMAGYTRFQFGLYLSSLFLVTFAQLFSFTVLAFFCHIVSPNKYIGYFMFIGLAIFNFLGWGMLDIETNMIQFASLPSYIYSDLFGFAPYTKGLAWFGTYWVLFCVLLSCVGVLLWQRGRDRGFWRRIRTAVSRFHGEMALATCASLGVWLAVGGWVFYNTKVLNEYMTDEQGNVARSQYELQLSDYATLVSPRITKISHNIDVFPHQRGIIFKGDQTIVNRSDKPIEKIFINLADGYETELKIDNAKLIEEMEDVNVQIYELDPPMSPGAESKMEYTVSYFAKGFENSVSTLSIVQNGSFFNNGIAPQMGYQKGLELTSENDRKRLGLSPPEIMPPLEPDNMEARANTYLSNSSDWVEVETTISTSEDQIAIAPGSLQKRWKKDGRHYFHYTVDHPSVNMYSFISADYEVAARKWKDVDVEVYYHKEHEWNVDKMLFSIRKSLEYFSENFGPYKHNQARIIEFPRTSTFAQAFPGTMPYSEGIGFIADIKEEDDIDMVFYVVAHEMAHQWWAHQVIGANMKGATVLSETLAQYSSLMVMEKEFGRDIMRKFLKYEMNSYLQSRGQEMLEEETLMEVGAQQGYVHYRKGSVVMYYLKEMIGEDKMNTALKSLIEKFAYQDAPYPTSADLVEALREQTPTEYEYLLDDLFKKITLFENRVLTTSYRSQSDGKYEVTVDLQCQKYQANKKGKQELIEINDWIEIGAFAKPEEGREYGKTLYRERVKINEEKKSFTFVVDEVPALAGVDPFLLLIDRLPDDNMKKPALVD